MQSRKTWTQSLRAAVVEPLLAIADPETDLWGMPHEYVPAGACAAMQESTAEEVMISGPAGTGKSRGVLELIHEEMQAYPGARSLFVRKTRESMHESVLFTFEEHVLGRDHPMVVNGPQRNNRQNYVYPNGSKIIIAGMDKPGKLMSTEYDYIYFQEAIEGTERDWEYLITRGRNEKTPRQQLIGDTNPGPPQHWIKDRARRGLMDFYDSTHKDNPLLWNARRKRWTPRGRRYLKRLKRLTGVRRQWFLLGLWVRAVGAVFGEFDQNIHMVYRRKLRADFRRIITIDFGYTAPFVAQWWALGRDNQMIRYREIYMTNRLVEDHARLIRRLSEGERIEAVVADHDAEDMATMRKWLACQAQDSQGALPPLRAPVIPAWKKIRATIQAVKSRMAVKPNGRPGIVFMRDSTVEADLELIEAKRPLATEHEMDSYTWPTGIGGEPNMKEVPVDKDNHGIDATRYAVAYFDEMHGQQDAPAPTMGGTIPGTDFRGGG